MSMVHNEHHPAAGSVHHVAHHEQYPSGLGMEASYNLELFSPGRFRELVAEAAPWMQELMTVYETKP